MAFSALDNASLTDAPEGAAHVRVAAKQGWLAMRKWLCAAALALLGSGAANATSILIGPNRSKSVFAAMDYGPNSNFFTLPVAGAGAAYTVELVFQTYPSAKSCSFNCDVLSPPITAYEQFDDSPYGAAHPGFLSVSDAAYNITLNFSSTSGANLVIDLPNNYSPLPEPMSWAMMVIGFGLTGSFLRRRASPIYA